VGIVVDMLDFMVADAETDDPRLDIARRNIRVAVALRGTNFAETARQAGLSRNAVAQFVKGRTSMSYANMLRVCDVLDIPLGALHQPDAITEQRLRLHKILQRLPDHLLAPALEAALRNAPPQD